MTRIDVARLRKALDHVTAHPEEWDQSYWIGRTACGTTACLAGTVVLHAGYEPYEVTDAIGQLAWVYVAADDPLRRHEDVFGSPDPRVVSVPVMARRLLGVSRDDSYELFSPHLTLEDLWEVAAELTDGAIEVPPDLADRAACERHDGEDAVR